MTQETQAIQLPVEIQQQQALEAQKRMESQMQQQPQQNMPAGPEQGNPFASPQYNNMGVPDVPMNFGGGMTELLLSDYDVPEAIRKKFWFIFNKDNVLTFLDEDRKKSKMLNLEIVKIDMLNQMPYYSYDFQFELDWDILKNAFETKLDRALGFKNSNMLNERKALQSQFAEQRQINEVGEQGSVKEGFFKRLLGRR